MLHGERCDITGCVGFPGNCIKAEKMNLFVSALQGRHVTVNVSALVQEIITL